MELFVYLTGMKNRKNRDKTEEADNDAQRLSVNEEEKRRDKFKDACSPSNTTPALYKQE